MTLKRSSNSNVVNGNKRQKQSQTSLVDTFIQDKLAQCSECQNQRVTDCINMDFQPRIYFSLALILEDSSCHFLLRNHEDPTVCQLNDYAYKLSTDNNLVLNTLTKLTALCSAFTADSIQELSLMLFNKGLHEERELKFIGTCLENIKSTTIDMIQYQSTSDKANLESILFSDIRMARLLPLLAIVYDDSPAKSVDLTRSDDENSLLSTFLLKQNSDMDVFELDEDGNIIDPLIPEETQDPFIFPAPSEITLPDDTFEGDNLPIRAQSPSVSLVSFPNSQDMSIPDYEVYTTAELKAKVKQYGYRPSNSRASMIKDLQKIYSSIHNNTQSSIVSQKRVMDSDVESGVDSPIVTSSQNTDAETRKKIITHIKSNKDLWNRILNYESVSVDECNVGLNCKKSAVKLVLDEFGASSQILNKKFKASD